MKIYLKEKPAMCGLCKLVLVNEVPELKCPLIDLESDEFVKVEHDSVHKDCPIVELNPKQLEWTEYKNDSCKAKPFYEIEHEKEFSSRYSVYILNNLYYDRDTLDKAKQVAQDHYNKIFHEMIGG